MLYRIIVKNRANCEIYNRLFESKTENDAVKDFLEWETLYDGDTLKIEEY